MFAGKLRYYRPNLLFRSDERFPQRLNGCVFNRRTINQRDHRRIPAMIEHLAQSDLQRTELPSAGIMVDHERRPVGINRGRQGCCILSNHDDYKLGGREERTNRR